MDPHSKWIVILARTKRRKLLPLDVEHCSPIALRNILLDVRTPDDILERIAHTYCGDEDVLRDLVRCPNLSETTLTFIALTASDEIKSFIAGTRVIDVVMGDEAVGSEAQGKAAGGKKKLNLQQIVLKMSPAQKIKLALTGAKEARGLLVRESAKIVATSVLDNPRITVGEIEFFAKSTNLSEDILRKIGNNSEWSKKYGVVSALVSNPKTPIGVSLNFVNKLTDRDLGILEKSRNIPEAIRTAARTRIVKRKLGKG